MSDSWSIRPEPTGEELAALIAALVDASSVGVGAEPAPEVVSAWRATARREAVDARAGSGGRWTDRS